MNELLQPIMWNLPKVPGIILKYYELRVWRDHFIVKAIHFKTKKEAIKYYKEYKYDVEEDYGQCYVEIIRVNPLKK